MFSTMSQHSTTKTDKYVKELSLSFPSLKTELKNPIGSFFIVVLFSPIVEIVYVLIGHIALSQLLFKILS